MTTLKRDEGRPSRELPAKLPVELPMQSEVAPLWPPAGASERASGTSCGAANNRLCVRQSVELRWQSELRGSRWRAGRHQHE